MKLREFLGDNPQRLVEFVPVKRAITNLKPVTVEYLLNNLLETQLATEVNIVDGREPTCFFASPLPPYTAYKVTLLCQPY